MTLTINNFYVFFPAWASKTLDGKQFRASEIPHECWPTLEIWGWKMLDVDRLVAGSEIPKNHRLDV